MEARIQEQEGLKRDDGIFGDWRFKTVISALAAAGVIGGGSIVYDALKYIGLETEADQIQQRLNEKERAGIIHGVIEQAKACADANITCEDGVKKLGTETPSPILNTVQILGTARAHRNCSQAKVDCLNQIDKGREGGR